MTAPERVLKDRAIVFFGGTAGIGRAAMMEVARRGAAIAVVGRTASTGADAIAAAKRAGAASAEFLHGDLSSLAGVAQAAAAVRSWRPELSGIVHSAIYAFSKETRTTDGFELAFGLQYLARASLNRLLVDCLAASGDGRIIHVGGEPPKSMKPNVDDPNFEHTKWKFFASILNSHLLGFLHVEEAQRRWSNLPVSLAVAGVPPTKTKAMQDPDMPLAMRLMAVFGTSPEKAARGVVALLARADIHDAAGKLLPKPALWSPRARGMDARQAAQLWQLTTDMASLRGLMLPELPITVAPPRAADGG